VETIEVYNIFQRSAVSGGNVIDDGGSIIKARGICWNMSGIPAIKDNHTTENGDIGIFVSTLNGLKRNTIYHVRAYATNGSGTGYGNEVTFKSAPLQLAELNTDFVTSITSTSAISGGVIYSDGGDRVTSNGICWSTIPEPTVQGPHTSDETGNEHFESNMTGLKGNTTYYVRAYAANTAGIAYGIERSFKTYSDSAAIVLFSPILFNSGMTYETVTDIDGNIYKTIRLGNQIWMAENLKTTSYFNGAQIGNLDVISLWPGYKLDAFCWYMNDISSKACYGALYNWYAVSTGKLCPVGWHIPDVSDFEELITFLGGESSAGKKLKESGAAHWLPPDSGANNESGFSSLPGGILRSGQFESFREAGYWWSSTGNTSEGPSCMTLKYNSDSAVINFGSRTDGISVRCIKDNSSFR
jgi:uncharacterized protein (TIGR02145 family)